MIFAAVLAAHSFLFAQTEKVEIPILHIRPSKVLERMKPLEMSSVSMVADDEKGVIVARGSRDDINQAQTYMNLFDVARRKVAVDVFVDAPLDHSSYRASSSVFNNEWWMTKDSDTGIQIEVAPRINDDNSVTVNVNVRNELRKKTTKTAFRIKNREKFELAFNSRWELSGSITYDREPAPPRLNPKDTLIVISPSILGG